MFARPLIDSLEFARNGKEMHGEIALSELSRLSDVLVKTDGSLIYMVRGYREAGRDMLGLSLQGKCSLRCQRCLGELEYSVNIVSQLQLLPADKLDEVKEDDDEMDVIEAESKLDVVALIEEEMLLELPFAPRHTEGGCAQTANDLQQKVSPFAVLAGLKK